MEEEARHWKEVSGLDEVQVFRNGEMLESFSGDGLSVELFDKDPEDNNE